MAKDRLKNKLEIGDYLRSGTGLVYEIIDIPTEGDSVEIYSRTVPSKYYFYLNCQFYERLSPQEFMFYMLKGDF